MADGFNLHIFTEPWDEMQAALKVQSDRATMYALRATGRAVVKGARSQAPVYQGDDPRATAESGQLKKGIKSGRTIARGGGTYTLQVMPVGSKKKGSAVHKTDAGELRGVPLYRRQMNQKYGFMQAGINLGDGAMFAIYDSAYKKAFAKYAP